MRLVATWFEARSEILKPYNSPFTSYKGTFNTPTRRTSKPRVPTTSTGTGGNAEASSSAHKPPRKNVKDLEARMASLEEQLRRSTEVPPHVHNQALSQLDASLLNPSMTSTPSGTTTPTPPTTTLPPVTSTSHHHGPSHLSHQSYPTTTIPVASTLSSSSSLPKSTFPPPFLPPAIPNPSNPDWGLFDFSLKPNAPLLSRGMSAQSKEKEKDRGGDGGLEKQMEGMNLSPGFIYLDEMGMT